jgi:hypothetical protein
MKSSCLGQLAAFSIPRLYPKLHILEIQNEWVFKKLVQLYYIKVQLKQFSAELLIDFYVFSRDFNIYIIYIAGYASCRDALRLRQKVSIDSKA